MSQNSLVLPTTGTVSGLQQTQNTNNALDTLNTLASGASAPSSPEASQFWHDTTNNILKLRSLDNTSWISLLSLNESSYLSTPYSSGATSGGNRAINGGMAIDQANEGSSYSVGTGGSLVYTLDQWQAVCKSTGGASGITAQQVSDAPPGFTNSLKLTVGTGAGSVGTTDLLQVSQPLEGSSTADFAYGNSNAAAASLSFWVKSSVTGTFSVLLANSGGARTFVTTFTIASAGVWQPVQIPNIPGDQSGTWPTNNTQGLSITISAAAGTGEQTSTLNAWQSGAFLAANTQTNTTLTTTGATFQITGVMLNIGSFCLPFEKKLFGKELRDCQRYFEKSYDSGTAVATASNENGSLVNVSPSSGVVTLNSNIKVTKRTAPSVTLYSPNSGTSGKIFDATATADLTASAANIGQNNFQISPAGTAGHVYTAHWAANARI
jgi:hypothetical protein